MIVKLSVAMSLAAVAAAAQLVGACASAQPKSGPAWVQEALARQPDVYPDITGVPAAITPEITDAEAAAARAALLAEQQKLLASAPPAPSAPADAARGFDAGARAELENVRPQQ